MKFRCQRCGRSYAVSDALRGKTFEMKCRACGHLVAVGGSRAAEPHEEARDPQGQATPWPVAAPGAPAGDEPLIAPLEVPEVNPFVARPISAAALGKLDADLHAGGAGAAGPPLPAAEQYIDLVIEDEVLDDEPSRASESPPGAPPGLDRPGFDDPFADWRTLAGRGNAPLSEPIEGEPVQPPTDLAPARAAPRAPREPWPEAAAAPSSEGLNPKVLAVAGVVAVAVLAVLLFVYVGRGREPGPSAPVTAQPALVAPRLEPPPPAPAAAKPEAAPAAPIPSLAETSRDEEAATRRTESAQRKPKPARVAREERRAEPPPEPPERAPQPAPEPPPPTQPVASAAPAAAPAVGAAPRRATGPLTKEQTIRIVAANRPAFEQCIVEAGKRDSSLDLSGRQVTLMLTVNPNGKVAYPTIDDVELAKTDLGACIKSAARLMMFPAFEGDPMKIEVPLALGR
ncbi:MAG TPA: zinc-ribbon domain-containing protein [Anaeromyxobacteraceae bacterium]|nr:zinc-ribbon domain-containing protein [Anaeromyxobacteraceae bacterium]